MGLQNDHGKNGVANGEWYMYIYTLRIQICPKRIRDGTPIQSYDRLGWDFPTINPTNFLRVYVKYVEAIHRHRSYVYFPNGGISDCSADVHLAPPLPLNKKKEQGLSSGLLAL